MLILITSEEIQKFPLNGAPYSLQLLAQNMQDYKCCGLVNGDTTQFILSGIIYEEVTDIPSGYEQRALPPQYGIYLNTEQITTGLMLENKVLTKQRADIDFIAIMADIDLGV